VSEAVVERWRLTSEVTVRTGSQGIGEVERKGVRQSSGEGDVV
jgi:hypothetical protein